MVDRAAALATVIQQVLVGETFAPGRPPDHIGTERGACRIFATPSAFDVRGAIDLGGEVVDPYFRRRTRVGASDAKRATALGAQ